MTSPYVNRLLLDDGQAGELPGVYSWDHRRPRPRIDDRLLQAHSAEVARGTPCPSAKARTVKRLLLAGLVCLCSCLPQDRINTRCDWANDSAGSLDLSHDKDRRHLEADANLAEDLGIRYGDTFRSTDGIQVEGQKRGECTRELLALIASKHRVRAQAVESARGARNTWIDVALIYIPMAIVFAFVARWVVRKIRRSLDDEPRWMLLGALVFAVPIVAGFGLMGGEQYEWLVEWARLRNAHLSYRAFRMPITHHALVVWLSAMLIFTAVAVVTGARRGKRLSR